MGKEVVHAVRARLTRPSITLVASLAAAAAFAIALLVGWATAGTREDLGHAMQLPAARPAPRLVLLGNATRLPPAPPAARAANPAAKIPRLVVGSG